jgi:type II secretory pathway pseudopilin PulG
MMRSSRAVPPKGFVLLMVMIAILVVGLSLTVTAQRSLLSHRTAVETQRSLQTRWGMASCQKTMMPAAGGLMDASERTARRQRGKQEAPPSTIQGHVILGGQSFDLLIGDEDAKANVNTIFDVGGRPACEQTISRLVGPLESRSIRLLPARASQSLDRKARTTSASSRNASAANEPEDAFHQPPAFRSWGEVFDLAALQYLAGDDRHLASMTRRIALRSSGKLNVFRAQDETVLAVCQTILQDGLARRVLEKIRETTLRQIDLILDQTVTNTEDRRSVSQLLSANSTSYSLWIEAVSRTSRHQRLVIQAPDINGTLRTWEYSFE